MNQLCQSDIQPTFTLPRPPLRLDSRETPLENIDNNPGMMIDEVTIFQHTFMIKYSENYVRLVCMPVIICFKFCQSKVCRLTVSLFHILTGLLLMASEF